jgi:hypothetical protein
MRVPWIVSMLIAPCALLCGCSVPSALSGEPTFDVTVLMSPAVVNALHPTATAAPPTQAAAETMVQPRPCAAAFETFDTDKADRDTCVKELLVMVDVRYAAFKKHLLGAVGETSLAADMASFGLGAAGSLVPGATTKSILSGLNGSIAATRTAVDADLLYNSSIIIIINQMDTDRANEKCAILAQLKNETSASDQSAPPLAVTLQSTTTVGPPAAKPAKSPTTTTATVTPISLPTYTMYDASADLVQYYEDGTFAHALQALQAKSGSQATSSKQQLTDQKSHGTTASDASKTTPASACASS